MFKVEQCPDVTGTSLQGYLDAKMSDIVHAFGKPSVVDYDEGEKVSHCWDLVFTDAAGEPVRATIYDWKYYDGGIAALSDVQIRWNIGGDDTRAVWFVKSAMRRGGND